MQSVRTWMTRQPFPRTLVLVARWLDDEEQRAWRGLLQMTGQLDVELGRRLQETSGLSGSDFAVLVPLSEAPGGALRPFAIAQELGWEQSRLSHHLSRMQRRGLVERVQCEVDGRGSFVQLTDAGRAAIEAAAPAHVAAVRALVFDGLTREQVRVLGEVSAQVLDRLAPPQD